MKTALKQALATRIPRLASCSRLPEPNAHTPYLDSATMRSCTARSADSLEEAIKRSGLKDGMTISFHHAFREGDKVINKVVDTLAKLGFKNLTLASSSLCNCHDPLVEHIKNGVITQIYTSGLRGKLAEAISNGLMTAAGADPFARRARPSAADRRTQDRRGLPRRRLL